MTDNPETFTCAVCGETFEKAWSDEDADAEAAALWTPEELAGGIAIICDDCFQPNIERVQEEVRALRSFVAWVRESVGQP
jgi:hypothetical protein